jgi:hypothetical protein
MSEFGLFVGSASLALGSALAGRAYFLLLRQKKVAKEKATPRAAPYGSLALLGVPGGWLNSPAARTTPAEGPRPTCVAQRLPWGPQEPSLRNRWCSNWQGRARCGWFFGPLGRCRATQALAEKGRGLFEGRSPEFRSPRQRRVAQGTPRSGAPTQGWPFLWLLSFGHTKESTPAPQGRNPTPASRTTSPRKAPRGVTP